MNSNEKYINNLLGFENQAFQALHHHWDYFLKSMGLTTFTYLQFHNDGTFLNLCSDQNWSPKYYRMEKIDGHFLQAILHARNIQDFHTYFWPQDPLKGEITSWLIDHGIGTGFTIFKSEADFVHGWGFTGQTHINDLMNFFLQNREHLLKFCLEFAALYKTYGHTQKKIWRASMGVGLLENKAKELNIPHSNSLKISENMMIFTKTGPVILSHSLWQVVDLLAQGYGQKQIAQTLAISPKTVEQRLSNLRHKLGVYSRDQLFDIWKHNRG